MRVWWGWGDAYPGYSVCSGQKGGLGLRKPEDENEEGPSWEGRARMQCVVTCSVWKYP